MPGAPCMHQGGFGPTIFFYVETQRLLSGSSNRGLIGLTASEVDDRVAVASEGETVKFLLYCWLLLPALKPWKTSYVISNQRVFLNFQAMIDEEKRILRLEKKEAFVRERMLQFGYFVLTFGHFVQTIALGSFDT